MNLISLSQPWLTEKQQELDFQDLQGLWRIEWKFNQNAIYSGIYTRVDQAFIVWGLIAGVMFATAQFLPISWTTQAIWWSVLSLVGTVMMVRLTWFWAGVERLRWVVCGWGILMLTGVVLTDLGIFLGWGEILLRLCPMWLGLSAVGYLLTGVGLRSRALFLAGCFHILSIFCLPYVGGWQFLSTGAVMSCSLLLLAQLQWDMRSPIKYALLSAEQQLFNRTQHQQRSQKSGTGVQLCACTEVTSQN
jgi:hypothetical protein